MNDYANPLVSTDNPLGLPDLLEEPVEGVEYEIVIDGAPKMFDRPLDTYQTTIYEAICRHEADPGSQIQVVRHIRSGTYRSHAVVWPVTYTADGLCVSPISYGSFE